MFSYYLSLYWPFFVIIGTVTVILADIITKLVLQNKKAILIIIPTLDILCFVFSFVDMEWAFLLHIVVCLYSFFRLRIKKTMNLRFNTITLHLCYRLSQTLNVAVGSIELDISKKIILWFSLFQFENILQDFLKTPKKQIELFLISTTYILCVSIIFFAMDNIYYYNFNLSLYVSSMVWLYEFQKFVKYVLH